MVTVPIKWWKYGRLCGECMSDEQKRVKPDAGDDLANEADHTETTGRKSGTRASDHHFAGAYSHGIDSKGRMIIPANFRTALGDHFVVALTPDFKHIALYPEEEWLNRQDKLQKLAGLELKENSSGKHKGRTSISKRGRKRLRRVLFQAVLPLIRSNAEFREVYESYTTRQSNPLKGKQAVVAVGCKLIRIFYAILTKGIDYDANRLRSDILRPEQRRAA